MPDLSRTDRDGCDDDRRSLRRVAGARVMTVAARVLRVIGADYVAVGRVYTALTVVPRAQVDYALAGLLASGALVRRNGCIGIPPRRAVIVRCPDCDDRVSIDEIVPAGRCLRCADAMLCAQDAESRQRPRQVCASCRREQPAERMVQRRGICRACVAREDMRSRRRDGRCKDGSPTWARVYAATHQPVVRGSMVAAHVEAENERSRP